MASKAQIKKLFRNLAIVIGVVLVLFIIRSIRNTYYMTDEKLSGMSEYELSKYVAENIDDLSSENVQHALKSLDGIYGFDKKILVDIIKSHPLNPLLKQFYRTNNFKFLSYLDSVDSQTFEIVILNNLKLLSTDTMTFETIINDNMKSSSMSDGEYILTNFTERVNLYLFNKYPNLFKKYIAELQEDKYSIEKLKRGINTLYKANFIDNEKRNRIINYLEAKAPLSGYENELESKQTELNKIDEEISKILVEKKDIFTLSGYMIQKESYNTYEVQPFHISSRAILKTTNTTFQSRGKFIILVKKEGSMPVTLKEEYGGFSQNWPVYIEASSGELEELNSKLSQFRNERNEILKYIDESIQKIQVQKSKLTKVNIDLKSFLHN